MWRRRKSPLVKVVDPAPPQPPHPRRSRARSNCWPRRNVRSRSSARVRPMRERTRKSARLSRRRGFRSADVDGEGPSARRPSAMAAAARSFAIGQADVVLLAGARLNWLLSHGRPPLWSEGTRFIQIDISPTEFDSNRAIAAPVVGDIKSEIAAFNAAMKPGQVKRHGGRGWKWPSAKRRMSSAWRRGSTPDPSPMRLFLRLARRAQRARHPPCLYRQRGRQHPRFRSQHRHGQAAAVGLTRPGG